MTQLTAALLFLTRTLFDLYLLVLMLRLILQMVGFSFYNPISQLVVKLTDPLVLPLRRILPRISLFDLTIVTLLLVLNIIKFGLLILIAYGLTAVAMPNLLGLLFYVVIDLLKQVVRLYFYAVIIRAVLSWFGPGQVNPLLDVLYAITEPLLAPVRRYIPPVSGFDLSPMAVLLALYLVLILLG